MKDKYTHLVLHSDGGSRNNPGAAGIGFVIYDEDKKNILYSEGKYIGTKTNNEAEYTAMLMGIMKVLELYPDCDSLDIFADSELVVRQITGIYKIKEPGLKILAEQIHQQLKRLVSYKVTHVLRKFNKEADLLVNEALDKAGY